MLLPSSCLHVGHSKPQNVTMPSLMLARPERTNFDMSVQHPERHLQKVGHSGF
ncbi:hypothetical protein ILYODFUR_037744, partial [Ilyodon furcidens]